MANRILRHHLSLDKTHKKRCNETGWGLYASEDIAAREFIISIERPLVISLDIPRLKDTCYNCLGYGDGLEAYRNSARIAWEEDKKLQVCAGCYVVRYCSKVSIPFIVDSTPVSPSSKEPRRRRQRERDKKSLCDSLLMVPFIRSAKRRLGNQYTSMNAVSLLACTRTSYQTTSVPFSSSCFFGKQIGFRLANGMLS